MAHYHVIFDGPPSPEGPHFIEVDNDEGKSIKVGEWSKRADGLWALVLPAPVDAPVDDPGVTVNALVWTKCKSFFGFKLLAFDTFGHEYGRIESSDTWSDAELCRLKSIVQSEYDKRVLEAITVRPLPVEHPLVTEGKAVAAHIATQKEVCLLELSVSALQEELKRQKRISKQRMKLLQAARAKIQHMRKEPLRDRDGYPTKGPPATE
jgi:hypothetical protein